jgi:hypothetical protein
MMALMSQGDKKFSAPFIISHHCPTLNWNLIVFQVAVKAYPAFPESLISKVTALSLLRLRLSEVTGRWAGSEVEIGRRGTHQGLGRSWEAGNAPSAIEVPNYRHIVLLTICPLPVPNLSHLSCYLLKFSFKLTILVKWIVLCHITSLNEKNNIASYWENMNNETNDY